MYCMYCMHCVYCMYCMYCVYCVYCMPSTVRTHICHFVRYLITILTHIRTVRTVGTNRTFTNVYWYTEIASLLKLSQVIGLLKSQWWTASTVSWSMYVHIRIIAPHYITMLLINNVRNTVYTYYCMRCHYNAIIFLLFLFQIIMHL